MFPLFFVLLFLSLDEPAAEPDRDRLVPHDRHLQPGLLPLEAFRSLLDRPAGTARRWRSASASRSAIVVDRPAGRERRPADEAGAHVSAAHPDLRIDRPRGRLAHPAQLVTNPALLLPSIIFPLFFFIAFAGGLSAISNVPGFDFPSGYTAFQFVFVLLQSSAFGGVFTGFGIAARLRVRLRPAADARGAEPPRRSSPATRWRRSIRALRHAGDARPRRAASPACRSTATASTSSASRSSRCS